MEIFKQHKSNSESNMRQQPTCDTKKYFGQPANKIFYKSAILAFSDLPTMESVINVLV